MVSDAAKKQILATVDDRFDEQLAATAELVTMPSRREHEEPVRNLVESHLWGLGFAIDSPELKAHPGFGLSTVDYTGMTNVVGTFDPTGGTGKSLILNGHINAVQQGPEDTWSRSPWDTEVVYEWMYDRGASDMKTGLVANLFAFEAIRQAGFDLTGRVHLQSVIEEEHTGNGSLAALPRGYTADAVIISEPEEDALVTANVGVLWFIVKVSGHSTHPREMAKGSNDIDVAFEVMQTLRVLEQAWNDRKGEHRYFEDIEHPINFNFGGIHGGNWPSSVPAWCDLQVRVATYPGTKAEEVWAEVAQCVTDAGAGATTNGGVSAETGSQSRAAFDTILTPNDFYADGYVLYPGSDAEALLEQTRGKYSVKSSTASLLPVISTVESSSTTVRCRHSSTVLSRRTSTVSTSG